MAESRENKSGEGEGKGAESVKATRAGKGGRGPKIPEATPVSPAEQRAAQARAQQDRDEALNASPGFREAPANPSHESTLGALDGTPPEVAREYARTGVTPRAHVEKMLGEPPEERADAGMEVDPSEVPEVLEKREQRNRRR